MLFKNGIQDFMS